MRLRHGPNRSRHAGLACLVAVLCAFTAAGFGGAGVATASAQPPFLTTASVGLTVDDVSPSTPVATNAKTPLTFTLTLVNRSDQTLDGLTVQAVRATPITTQADLDAAIAKPHEPVDPSLVATVPARTPVTASLAPGAQTEVSYATTSSLVDDRTGLCICHAAAIYPIYFTVSFTDVAGDTITVGSAQTYVPAFDAKPRRVQVSWLWPIIDRPHRADLADPRVFTDDDLATSVATGRLSRVLAVAELTARRVPLTLVVDPELIDELAVMSTGNYRVRVGSKTVPGTGAAAARHWLAGLRSVLAAPGIELVFTPPADPDVQSLTRAGLTWQTALPAAQQAQVRAALGGHVGRTDIMWPADDTINGPTAAAAAAHGVTTVVLDDGTMPPTGRAVSSAALAPFASANTVLVAAVASTGVQRYVLPALSVGGGGTSRLPLLVAEVAMRTIASDTTTPYVVIAPPRTIDPMPTAAARAIEDTARASWSAPVTVTTAAQTIGAEPRPGLVTPVVSRRLPSDMLHAIHATIDDTDALQSMLLPANAAALLANEPEVVQRLGSSAWSRSPSDGTAYAADVTRQLDALTSGVRIQQPSTGSYTLASRNSPLPLTIDNDLPYPVRVQVAVSAADGLPGFSASAPGVHEIPADSRLTLQIHTHVERTGRFPVQVSLLAPNGDAIGATVILTVHSTALGTIGIIITIVAGAVLVLALCVRLVRRLARRRRTPPPPPVPQPEAMVRQ